MLCFKFILIYLYFLNVLRGSFCIDCLSSPDKQCAYVFSSMYVAVKAGGMRIVQKHQAAAVAVPEPPQKDDEEEYISSR